MLPGGHTTRRIRLAAITAAMLAPAALLPAGAAAEKATGPGSFSAPFTEPTVGPLHGHPRVTTDDICIERPGGKGATQSGVTQGFIDCKPAAGGMSVLPGGKVLYWDALAGTENIELSILSEFGVTGLNDQSRVLDIAKKTWTDPDPVDGGVKSAEKVAPLLLAGLLKTSETQNDGSFFCADFNFLSDGRVIAAGGTKYANDPGNDLLKFGSTELLGIENTRVYDPKTNKWTQLGSMHKGRWYPSLVTLGDGKLFVVSGLRRLVKPVNVQDPINSREPLTGLIAQEGQNERVTETFDLKTGRWTQNPDSARRSLPLFARIHLLPNGHVFYNAAGQAYNPLGQAYDEALWNLAASYDPAAKKWTDLGIPGLGSTAAPGFRGSTFSVMMPLKPDADGKYEKASFLTGGGVVLPSPGSYVAIRDSYISTVDTAKGNQLSSEPAGQMNPSSAPLLGRWYGQGTLLPTGEVLATSGADRDEVVAPGTEIPVMNAELFDPETKAWRKVAKQNRPRTYHNSAALLPDGKVLVGGHAVISNTYLRNLTLLPGITAPNGPVGRDPSFEIYSPPYLDCPGEQAKIKGVRPSADDSSLTITTDVPADQIKNVMLMRNTSTTHVTDADQRAVELQVVSRDGNSLTVRQPSSGNVLPPGPYMLFANRDVEGCVKPSVARQVLAGDGGKLSGLCLPSSAGVGKTVAGIRLGSTRATVASSIDTQPVGTTSSVQRWCTAGGSGEVAGVFARTGKLRLLTSTAPGYHVRTVHPGSSARAFRKAFPRRLSVGGGVYRVGIDRRRLVGVRGGKVTFVGVADKRLARNRVTLKTYLRRVGL